MLNVPQRSVSYSTEESELLSLVQLFILPHVQICALLAASQLISLRGADIQVFLPLDGAKLAVFPHFKSPCKAKLICCWLQLHIDFTHISLPI